MKYVIEFGVRGGAYTENLVVPTRKLAQEIARKLVLVFTNDPYHPAAAPNEWRMPAACARESWQTATHYVSVSKLDGVPREPAREKLWRVNGPNTGLEVVTPHNT